MDISLDDLIVQICYNGMISLDGAVGEFNSSPFPLTTGYAVLAAYWTDLDMRCDSTMYVRIDTTSCVLDRASTEGKIQLALLCASSHIPVFSFTILFKIKLG